MYHTGNGICDIIANVVPSLIVPICFSILMAAFVWALAIFTFIGDYDEELRGKAKALILWCILMFIALLILWGIFSWLFGLPLYTQVCRSISGF